MTGEAKSGEAFSRRIAAIPGVFSAGASDRLIERLGPRLAGASPDFLGLVAGVGGASPYLSRLMAKRPGLVESLVDTAPEDLLGAAIGAVRAAAAAPDMPARMNALRAAKEEAALVVAISEIAGVWPTMDAAARWSHFADACVDAAMRPLDEDPVGPAPAGVVALAMGKHGAFELNYSSDIDLIMLFDSEAAGEDDIRASAIRTARGVVSQLGDQTAEGYVFRVDLRLRPDPGVSAAAVSLNAAEAYYESFGQNWERAAFIKARAAAGDTALGETFIDRLRPFIWRRHLDYAAIDDVLSIKRQLHAAKGGGEIEFHGHDLKTGKGGIREIEFLVQTQQLILGGKDASLRCRATLDVLDLLAEKGRIDEAARERLSENYRYLRKTEHRIQMIDDEQTHRIPRSAEDAERLAVFLGEPSLAAFEERIRDVLGSTHRYFTELFGAGERLSAATGSLSFTGVDFDKDTLETLSGLGFVRPRDAAGAIRRWHTGELRATRTTRARELLTALTPRLLEALSAASEPDEAFVSFDAFLRGLPAGVQIFSLLVNNPAVFDTLIRIMTISPMLGRRAAERRHLLEALVESSWPSPLAPPDDVEAALIDELDDAASFEDALNIARRRIGEEQFQTAAQLAVGAIDPQTAGPRFSALADIAIAAMLPAAEAETERQYGEIEGAVAVVGLGRLGAGRMTAASDIDIMVIYDAPEGAQSAGAKSLDAVTYFTRLVRRFTNALASPTEEGVLYEVDMKLRPSGSAGPVAVSLPAFRRYYAEDAWTWEFMALTKARVVAASADFAARVETAIAEALGAARTRPALASDISDMRARLLAEKPADSPWDVKRAPGGLTDLEFIEQFAALKGWRVEEALADPEDLALYREAEALFEAVLQVSRSAMKDVFRPDRAGAALAERMAAACGVSGLKDAEAKLIAFEQAMERLFQRVIV